MNENKLQAAAVLNDLLSVDNRIWMAPLTRCRADNPEAAVGDLQAEYYAQRAHAGLIVSEATVVNEYGYGYVNVPGIHTQAQVEGWKKVTNAVHNANGKIFCQLWHVGRVSHPDFLGGKTPVSASAINHHGTAHTKDGAKETVTAHALTIEEIQQTVRDFQKAAANALEAGFDGVEIHSSNGYLFHQFFVNSSNQRTDIYGGSIENKTRFLFEVLDAVAEVIPMERVGLRLNPMMDGHVGIVVDEETAATFDSIVERLNDYKLAYLHLTRPGASSDKPYFINDVIGHYRKLYKGFLVANGAYDQASGEAELAANRADAIAYGKLFISNPNLPKAFAEGLPLKEWDVKTFYTTGPVGLTDY
jgi:N-ethylmaleimide reductase